MGEGRPIEGGRSSPKPPDEHSFDALVREMANGTVPRRRALRLMGGALVGAALASIPGTAWAACKPLSHKCAANSQCCSRRCIKNPRGNGKICGCPTGQTLCPAGNQCVTCSNTGEVVNLTTCKCECPSGQVVCNNACVSNVCDSTTGEVFNPASCKCECPTGEVLCDNVCVSNACGEGQTFNPATCECEQDVVVCSQGCGSPANYPQCGPADPVTGLACYCFEVAGGICGCAQNIFCAGATICTTSAECPTGSVCIVNTNCGSVCTSSCSGAGAQISTAQEAPSTPQRRRSGPTAAGR